MASGSGALAISAHNWLESNDLDALLVSKFVPLALEGGAPSPSSANAKVMTATMKRRLRGPRHSRL